MTDLNNEVKELHKLIGDSYCRYELSEDAYNHWLKLAGIQIQEGK